jgi:lambda family phage portal protein
MSIIKPNILDRAIGVFAPMAAERRVASRARMALLSSYEGAEISRRNADWTSNRPSADAAIIPDAQVLNARARDLIRNNWVAKAASRAHVRNVVGHGIAPLAMVEGYTGQLDLTINTQINKLFFEWADHPQFCDITGQRNFWQMQILGAAEQFAVGEMFAIVCYEPSSESVGLKLQFVEPEQLILNKIREGDNEVRGGVEVDAAGKPVAYHFYVRNPGDYRTTFNAFAQVRVPAERVLHFFIPERVRQTRGVTPLAPVMQSIKDLDEYGEAILMRARMEACIGLIVQQNIPTNGGLSPLGLTAGSTAQNGAPLSDIYPGMIAYQQPGEDVKSLVPSAPGNMYEPFITRTLRAIGAGVGLSYDALAREATGNYSAARQNMLEDEREIRPYQDALISQFVAPVYHLFVTFAVMEGRLNIDPTLFSADRMRFVKHKAIRPARLWIDPEKEANAKAILIENKLASREELLAETGKQFVDVMRQISNETQYAAALGIVFPENVSAVPASPTPSVPSATPATQAYRDRSAQTPQVADPITAGNQTKFDTNIPPEDGPQLNDIGGFAPEPLAVAGIE